MRTFIGKAATGFFPSAPRIVRRWSNTSATRPSITASSRFRRNTAAFWKNTVSNSMNAMCGIDLHCAPSGLDMFWGIGPRALPWAIACCRVAAAAGPKGAEGESPGQRPGLASHRYSSALKGPDTAPAQFSSLLSPWERLGEGCWPQASTTIKANLRGLGYGE